MSPAPKRRLRVTFDRALQALGGLALAEWAMRRGLTVLTYHRILPASRCEAYPFRSLAVSEEMFRQQAAELARRATVLTLREAADAVAHGRASPKPLVAITFDDGYADNHALAAPILAECGLRATFFVVAGLIGTDGELWYDVAARRWAAAGDTDLVRALDATTLPWPWPGGKRPTFEQWMLWLKRLAPEQRTAVIQGLRDPGPRPEHRALDRLMTIDELRHLSAAGHEIGSHTMTHPLLPQLNDKALRQELQDSRAQLESWIQAPVHGFCYPNGDHDDRVVDATAAAGYRHACTNLRGLNRSDTPALRLRRVDMNPSRSAGLSGRYEPASFRATLAQVR